MRRLTQATMIVVSILAIISCTCKYLLPNPNAQLIADFFCRFSNALALGALLGYERRIKNKIAGVRTHMMMSAGACLVTLVGSYHHDLSSGIDPFRMPGQIFSALGMFGLGVVIKKGNSTSGVTTLATLVFAVSVGTACGSYPLPLVVLAVLMAMIALSISYYYLPSTELGGHWVRIVGTKEQIKEVVDKLGSEIGYRKKKRVAQETYERQVHSNLPFGELSNIVDNVKDEVEVEILDA